MFLHEVNCFTIFATEKKNTDKVERLLMKELCFLFVCKPTFQHLRLFGFKGFELVTQKKGSLKSGDL